MADNEARQKYRSYLLRMWKNRGIDWRFSVEGLMTGNRKGFSSLGMLIDFLYDLIIAQDQPKEDS